MPRMIDLIRESAVPATLMRAAARGALSLPPAETLEVLVYLTKNPVFGQQAQLTLAGWNPDDALAVLSKPDCPPTVLDYFSAPANLRPALLPAMLDNPLLPELRLLELADMSSAEVPEFLLRSPRVRSARIVLEALLTNEKLSWSQVADVQDCLARMADDQPSLAQLDILEPEFSNYLRDHAAEIAEAENEPFHLIGWTAEEQAEIAASPDGGGFSTTKAAAHSLGGAARIGDTERLSIIQKIAKMSVGERVQLAMKGGREERFILIRDGAKVVSNAVLESPKLTDVEVETFASMKNVGEHVLRGIALKRKFMKRYAVKRLLTANPRCPLDVSLSLVKELLALDLKNLTLNKNVADVVRSFALKMWRERSALR